MMFGLLSSPALAAALPMTALPAGRRPTAQRPAAPKSSARGGTNPSRAALGGRRHAPHSRNQTEACRTLPTQGRRVRLCASSASGDDVGDEEPMVIMSGVSYDPSGEGIEQPVSQTTETDKPADREDALAPPPIDVEKLKMKLLSLVAGLDRGIASFPSQQQEVDVLAVALERSQEKPTRLTYPGDEAMGLLNGRWRLVYSSGFGSGSLGGRRPGPPAAVVPFSIGQVFQDIDTSKMELDNIVELCFRTPSLPFAQEDPEPTVLEINLGHSFQVMDINSVRIVFETTDVATRSPLAFLEGLPTFSTPMLPENLRPPQDLRAATFDVSFLDETLRITRGDRGELRVYTRA